MAILHSKRAPSVVKGQLAHSIYCLLIRRQFAVQHANNNRSILCTKSDNVKTVRVTCDNLLGRTKPYQGIHCLPVRADLMCLRSF
jgi:hypothetical protein